MKRFFYMTVLVVAVASVFVSCKDSYDDTIVNLKIAITGELNARAAYLAFADKAAEEDYKHIANMFLAAAAAERIHAKSHNEILKKLGEPEYTPTLDTPTVNSTALNIKAAIDCEVMEFTMIYPGFIATAKKEKCQEAVESFTLANLAEESHEYFFSAANKEVLDDSSVPAVFFVCERCGGMFTISFSKCGICQADTEKQYYIPLVFDAR